MTIHEVYMHRCLQLATLGKGFVSPNPMVGAVLVYDNEIIGEGYHAQYGHAHAEVNCIKSVLPSKKHLISKSTLYVSLEPCNHFGKTPPCSHLIVEQKIGKVVIGCTDNFSKVNGSGIAYLQNNGVEVVTNVLEAECRALNKHFFYFNAFKKPYIILKFAQTANAYIGNLSSQRLFISNEIVNIMVDAWRQNVDAVFVGKNTVLKDNPSLITKNYIKRKQLRMFIDDNLEVASDANIYKTDATTFIFNKKKSAVQQQHHFIHYQSSNLYESIVNVCTTQEIQSVLVEGGTKLLQYFINNNLFNEIRTITNNSLEVENGIKSPELKNHQLTHQIDIKNNTICYYKNANN